MRDARGERRACPDLDEATVNTIGDDQVRVQTRTLNPTTEVPKVRAAIAEEVGVADRRGRLQPDRRLLGRPDHRAGPDRARRCSCCWSRWSSGPTSGTGRCRSPRWSRCCHDLVLTIGIYALVGFTVTPATVIGVLTILGYSLYDTVVVFDKVRENVRDLTSSARPDLLRGGQPGGQPGAGPLDQHHDHRRAAGGGAAVRRCRSSSARVR